MTLTAKSRIAAVLALCFTVSVYVSHGVLAQQGLVLYDTFDERFLDPAKWSTSGVCSWSALECVREIRDEKLRLAARNYGATNSNDGVQYAPSELHFYNPMPVRTVTDMATTFDKVWVGN
jgi:hypothetical protein